RDTASDDERSNRGHLIERAARTIEQAVDGCLLETGGDIGCLVLAALVSAQDRALEAREREVRLGAAEQRTGQRNRFRVAFPRQLLDCGPPGKPKAEDLGRLVESFA